MGDPRRAQADIVPKSSKWIKGITLFLFAIVRCVLWKEHCRIWAWILLIARTWCYWYGEKSKEKIVANGKDEMSASAHSLFLKWKDNKTYIRLSTRTTSFLYSRIRIVLRMSSGKCKRKSGIRKTKSFRSKRLSKRNILFLFLWNHFRFFDCFSLLLQPHTNTTIFSKITS